MDSTSFEGFVLDPAKCSKLSMEEKREIVYEISKWSNGAPELLQSWSRQDILQILCAEMGKERKYTGLTKLKIIENLLKVVSEKTSVDTDLESELSSQRVCKKQRKTDHPNRIPSASNSTVDDINSVNNLYCKNSACKAKLSGGDRFCKRCSCCICYQFDDNKDPSLWLTCSLDPPFEGNKDYCGLSCHLECALKDDRSGISKKVDNMGLDGSFRCVSCEKVNDLLGCWRKQMITARDTRRVDILCYRVSLGQKLLMHTNRYKKLYGIVSDAMKKLEEEVGPLTGLPVKRARGIVNRLSSGQEVQKLCAYAIESLDFMLSDSDTISNSSASLLQGANAIAPHVQFENVGPTFLTVNVGSEGPSQENGIGYTLWHRMISVAEYSSEPTCTLFAPNTRYSISNLTPSTEYQFKVVSFNSTGELVTCEVRSQTCSDDNNNKVLTPQDALNLERSQSPVTNCSSLSNPSSEGPITSVPKNDVYLVNNEDSPETQVVQETSTENDSNTPVQSGLECVPFAGSSDTVLPVTPCKLETLKDVGPGRKIRPKNSNDKDGSSKKREECAENGGRDFGYYVKVIRRLECDGHIETSFRQKFLTWYSLKANPQEMRIVKVFVDNLLDDPASLAGQLVDTFSDVISNKRPSSMVPVGLCLRLWH